MMDYNQDTTPTPVDQLFERAVIDLGIPPCPAILTKFMDEARKAEPDYSRLAEIITRDVSLSAGLVKTANSPYFGVRQRIRTVNEALLILGLNISSHAVAGIILRKSFPNVPNLERFWDASARFARLSGWLVQHLAVPKLSAEDAYTFGLFRDCGIPVLIKRYPHYPSVLDEANRDAERCFTTVEEAELPTNHAIVGTLLAQSWWLPEALCLSIRNHHDLIALESTNPGLSLHTRKLVAVTQLAEHLVQHQLGLSNTQEWLKLEGFCLKLLGLDESLLEVLYIEAHPIIASDE